MERVAYPIEMAEVRAVAGVIGCGVRCELERGEVDGSCISLFSPSVDSALSLDESSYSASS